MVDSKPRIGIIATTLVKVLAACGGADGKKPAEGSTSSNPVSGSDTVVEVPDTQFDGKTPVVVDTDMGGDVPSPDFTVRFSGEGCSLEGPAAFTAAGSTATLVAKVANETESTMAIVLGLHPGVVSSRW